MHRTLLGLFASVSLLAQAPASFAQSAPEVKKPEAAEKGPAKVSEADYAKAPVVEAAKTSRHTVTINGQTIPYTATAGTLTLRDDEGKPIASMFYAAYVADRAKGEAERPVTFLYNGGPGSSSYWLQSCGSKLVG